MDLEQESIQKALNGFTRVRIFFGDTNTGKDWGEEWDNIGYYMGRFWHRPVNIVKIVETKTHRVIYQHPKYHHGKYTLGPLASGLPPEYVESVYCDGDNVANFTKAGKGQRYIDFMTGKRMSH